MALKADFVSVVLLNFNNSSDTLKCLESLTKLNYPDFEVIIVDNKSAPEDLNNLKKNLGKFRLRIRLLEQASNLGFAGGNNAGAKASKARYVALLNNDTIVDKNWLSAMMKVMKAGKKTAIVGSVINNIDRFYGARETKSNVISFFGEPIEHDKDFTFMASGASMLFDRKVIGLPFDDAYFMYHEDTYAAWLARLRGYDVRIARDSMLDHLGGQVRKKLPELLEFHGEKNRWINVLIFYEVKSLLTLFPLFLLNLLLTIAVSVPKGRLWIRLKSYFWIAGHLAWIGKKRKEVQKQRTVPDSQIFSYISYKTPYQMFGFEKIYNAVSRMYTAVMQLRTIERRQPK